MAIIELAVILYLGHICEANAAFVDPNYKLTSKTWSGWGTSLVYSGKILGQADQRFSNRIAELIFSVSYFKIFSNISSGYGLCSHYIR